MIKSALLAAAASLGLLFSAMPAWPHHAFAAEFDANKGITVSGTLTKVEWTNPHAWLYVDVKDESGKLTSWSFELGSPNGLVRRGWRRAALKVGDQITVQGYAAKDGSNTANAHTVTLSDGSRVFSDTLGQPAK
jgi:hypothetical protein